MKEILHISKVLRKYQIWNNYLRNETQRFISIVCQITYFYSVDNELNELRLISLETLEGKLFDKHRKLKQGGLF